MSFIESIKKQALSNPKTIVLPETSDNRVLEAAAVILKEKFAKIILVGDKEEILKKATNLNLTDATFCNPLNYQGKDELINNFFELRKSKGITLQDAEKLITTNYLYFGVMLVHTGIADGMVAGAANSTGDVLRPVLQILKTAKGTKLVSSFFIMDVPNCDYGENGIFVFSDCGLNQQPNAEELANIAVSSANTFKSLIGKEPKVAMLSYSSKGSAKHVDVDKVSEATKLAKEISPELLFDGELQLDAAIVPEIAKSKAPDSKVAGQANVLIFPDLDSANIGYKLVERLAKAAAYGPILQGVKKPVNDLSRGCSANDIVGVTAITVVQAQNTNI